MTDYSPERAIETISDNFAYIKSPRGPSLQFQIHRRRGGGVRLDYLGNGRFSLRNWGIDAALKLRLEEAVAKRLQ